ncbi:MAG: endopeptidase La [Bacteroidota bacterium]|nr:endopeptidase La [Bacteroidota bacterium]
MEDNFDFLNNKLAGIIDGPDDIIPILSIEDEEQMSSKDIPAVLSILPIRNTVLFPGVIAPINVNREKSINLVREANVGDKTIGVVSQIQSDIEDPRPDDLNKVGTIARIIKLLQMPDGSTTAIIQGRRRFVMGQIVQEEPYIKAAITPFHVKKKIKVDDNFEALFSSLKDLSMQIVKLSPSIPVEASFAIKNIESPSFLINFISSNLNIEIAEKQKLLEITDLQERANILLGLLTKELQMLELKNQIQSKVKTDMDKQQREYMLNQQLKTIQEELGGTGNEQEILDLKEKAKTKKWDSKVADLFNKELNKLQRINPAAHEYSVQLNYLEALIELPWGEYTEDIYDMKLAEDILNKDHYGLEKVKERILEYLAVLKLKGDMKSPILCLVGPPGVGKTSLGKSIAKAIGRNYVRISLGGLHDEAEIRGHRKTYIGAMPGRIIKSIRKAKSSNPVFVLDEIDKVSGANVNGDPSSALLEVLDPEQNNAFYDNYLELEYDLSKVLFIATANNIGSVQPALRDRMEIIEISGYIIQEKVEIAKRHLIPKQLAEHGMKSRQLTFSKEVIEKLIDEYTRESGVRNLERAIAKVIRSKARLIAADEKVPAKITTEDLVNIFGASKYKSEKYQTNNILGVVTGLAWTAVGGDILFIEVSLSKGKGKLTLTGNLGDVMKESATIAFEFLKAHASQLNINEEMFEQYNVHIHVPEGATPKDGPSAGVTMLTALTSAFTKRKVKDKLAMTGEITLRGKVLPVGGIKEKILAAKRSNITELFLPADNESDVKDINSEYLKGLHFFYFKDMIDVINMALC